MNETWSNVIFELVMIASVINVKAEGFNFIFLIFWAGWLV